MAQNIDILINAKDMASKSIARVSGELEGLKKTGSSVGKSMSGFVSTVGGGLFKLGAIGGTALAGIGAIGLKTAGDFEQTATAFRTMLGDGEKAGKLLKDLSKFSAETPFEFPEIANAGKSLLAFGFEAEKIQGTLRTLGDIASSLNIPLGELSEIYGKAKTQGRLFAEDINQLTGRGIPIIQELAKQFGVADSEVKKMVEQGKVGFPELQKAMESMAGEGGKFAGGMANQSQTLQGLLSTAKDGLGNILNEIIGINQAGEITKGSILESAKGMLTGMIAFLNANTENIKAFFVMLKEMFTEGFTWLSTNVQKYLVMIQDFWKKHGENIIIVATFLWERVKLIAISVMEFLVPFLQNAFKIIGGLFDILASLIKGDFTGVWNGLKEVITGVFLVITSAVQLLVSLLLNIFGTSIPQIMEDFKLGWQLIWNSIKETFISIVIGIADFAVSKFNATVETIMGFVNKIKGFATEVKNYVNSMLDTAKNIGGNIVASVKGAVGLDGARANGGPVKAGGSYLVGERGPEIFTPRSSGQIIPNGGGGITINMGGVTVQNSADEDRLVEKIKRALTNEARLYNLGIS